MRTFLRTLEPGAATPFWKRIDPLVAAEWGAVLLVSLFYLAFKTYAMWLRAGDERGVGGFRQVCRIRRGSGAWRGLYVGRRRIARVLYGEDDARRRQRDSLAQCGGLRLHGVFARRRGPIRRFGDLGEVARAGVQVRRELLANAV